MSVSTGKFTTVVVEEATPYTKEIMDAIAKTPIPPPPGYTRTIRGVSPGALEPVRAIIDVYDVLFAFNVTCPATTHAIKKLLCAGQRGHKDRVTDIQEAITALTRALQLAGTHALPTTAPSPTGPA